MSANNIYLIVIILYVIILFPDFIKIAKYAKTPSINFNLNRAILKIHIIVLIFGLSLTIVFITYKVNIFRYSSPIEYANRHEISLNDFNGIKLPNYTLEGSEKFAYIVSNISIKRYNNGIQIKSLFHPARSYVYIDNLQDNILETHELYHFDITEIWARKLRSEIIALKKYPSNETLLKLYKRTNSQKNIMQNAYDMETNHGYLLGKQLKWQTYIDSTLSVLQLYDKTIVQF